MAVGLVSTGVQFPDSTIQTTAASASALVLVNSQSLSGASSYTITTGFSSTYDDYFFILTVTPSVSGTDINARLRKGTTVLSSNYDDKGAYAFGGSLVILGSYSNFIPMINSTAGGQSASVYGYLINVNSTAASAQSLFMNSLTVGPGSFADYVLIGGSNASAGAVTGIHFYISAGSFTGTFKLYGVAK